MTTADNSHYLMTLLTLFTEQAFTHVKVFEILCCVSEKTNSKFNVWPLRLIATILLLVVPSPNKRGEL